MIPTDLSNLVLWLKADALALNDGDAVGTWTDSSGNGKDATQATSAKKPVFKTAIRNGLPVIRFDGVDDWLQTPNITWGTTVSIFVVCTTTSTANGDVVNIYSNAIGSVYEMRVDGSSQIAFRPSDTGGGTCEATKGITILTGSWFYCAGVRAAGSSTAYVNGSAGSTNSGCATQRSGDSPVSIGEFSLGFQFFGGDVAEIVIYNAALGTSDRQGIEDYLYNKWFVAPVETPSKPRVNTLVRM